MSTTAVTLRPWPWATAHALVAGRGVAAADRAGWHPQYPTPDTLDALAMLIGAYEVEGPLNEAPPWWVLEVVVDGEVVGDAGFHGPPAAEGPVEVEIGYAVVPEHRGRGIATAACAQLLELAWGQGADTVLAETEPTNFASRRVLQRNGFLERPDGVFAIGRPE
jgi:GNAT superfamily N-acetyltransferase